MLTTKLRAITLTAFFYYLLRNPSCYAKLQHEIDVFLPSTSDIGTFCETRYADARTLPYLNACFQETFRIHPAFGFNYERVVGGFGATICGTFVPEGTIVGVNPWVVQRDTKTYGLDAHTYRPERWLEATDDKAKEMGRTLFQFGGGEHICLGKNISILEMYKLVPTLMKNFQVGADFARIPSCYLQNQQIELCDPSKEWTIFNGANVRMSGVNVRIKRR
jgi:cytochrome P450